MARFVVFALALASFPHASLAQAPTPTGAVAPAAPPKPPGMPAIDFDKVEIRTEKLAEGVYMLAGAGGNIGLSIGSDGALLVDDQYAPLTPKILAALNKLGARGARFVLNTHWHPDHTGGNENLGKSGAVVVAQHNVRKRMSVPQVRASGVTVPASPPAALPIVTFGEDATFHLNGEEIRVFHMTPSHTDGDVIVHFVKSDVVHMGDTFLTTGYPLVDRESGGVFRGFVAVADRVLAMIDDDTKVIPGHGVVTDKAGLKRWREMLATLGDRVGKLVKQGKTLEQVLAARVTSEWDAQYAKGFVPGDRLVTIVYEELKPKKP